MEVPHQQASQQSHTDCGQQENQTRPQLPSATRFLLQASGVGDRQEMKARLPVIPLLDETK